MEDSLEYTILTKRECYAYPVTAAVGGGFKATDFGGCVWKGRLQVARKDEVFIVKLVENNGGIFAALPIPRGSCANGGLDSFIERTSDSSRYFILKLAAGGKKALLGFGFDDRNDAFDFNACLVDFAQGHGQGQVSSHSRDLSLKDGEKISVGSLLRPTTFATETAGATKAAEDWFDFGDFVGAKGETKAAPTTGGPVLDLLD